jgi:hypothetical protein
MRRCVRRGRQHAVRELSTSTTVRCVAVPNKTVFRTARAGWQIGSTIQNGGYTSVFKLLICTKFPATPLQQAPKHAAHHISRHLRHFVSLFPFSPHPHSIKPRLEVVVSVIATYLSVSVLSALVRTHLRICSETWWENAPAVTLLRVNIRKRRGSFGYANTRNRP